MHTEAAMAAEADVCYSLLTYLKSIKNKRKDFIKLMLAIFGEERLNDTSFLYWLAKKLDFEYRNLKVCSIVDKF